MDWTLEQVAKKCGWTASFQSQIEKGKILLSREQALKLASVLKLDLSNFFLKAENEHV